MIITTEQVFTTIPILLTLINVLITYFNLRHNRKKDFQDKLFQLKIDAYKELNNECYEAIQRLDINSSPYVEIYDYEDKNDWIKYCEKNMSDQFHKSFELEKLIYKHTFLLPNSIINKYTKFAKSSTSFVTMSYHFDTATICQNQDKLWSIYLDLLNEFRKDLNIEIIDKSLENRITSNI